MKNNQYLSELQVEYNFSMATMSASSSLDTAASKTSTTAPKKTRRGKVPCGVCQGAIVDGKDQALLCEGECGLWLHRGCASVPPCLYERLSNSDEPFVCLTCANVQLKREILLLKSELKDVSELRDMCTALTNEVSSLRKALQETKRTSEATAINNLPATGRRLPATSRNVRRTMAKSYAQVTSLGAETGTKKPPGTNKKNQERRAGKPTDNASSERVVVSGVRRVWGVLKYCPTVAVIQPLRS